MNKEEKEAIKTFKNIVIQEYDWWINKGDYAESNVKKANDAIKTILKLIKKQQKELEKYQGIENGTTIIYKAKAKYIREDRIKKYYISKDKIREKLENLKDKEQEMTDGQGYWGGTGLQAQIEILEELLGEEE